MTLDVMRRVFERYYAPRIVKDLRPALRFLRRWQISQAVLEEILGRPPRGRFDGVTRIDGRRRAR